MGQEVREGEPRMPGAAGPGWNQKSQVMSRGFFYFITFLSSAILITASHQTSLVYKGYKNF